MEQLFQQIGDVFRNLFNSEALMHTLSQPEITLAAFIALNLIVFCETGLLVGFFLPGDSLLVTVGIVAATVGWNVPLLILTLSVSAIVGDSVGYYIGIKSGPRLFKREESWFFRKDHLIAAQRFYEQHGGKTIIAARFMPIIRTFAPVVAGIGRMDYRRFLMFNVVGGIAWVVSMILLGYYLPSLVNPLLQPVFGPEFRVEKHLEKVIIIIVLLSISPAIYAGIKAWLGSRKSVKAEPETGTTPVEAVGSPVPAGADVVGKPAN